MVHLDRREFLLGTTAVLSAAVAPRAATVVPAPAGSWSEQRLAAFTKKATELGVLGVVCLADGKIIVSHGEVSKPLRVASVRKSILNADWKSRSAHSIAPERSLGSQEASSKNTDRTSPRTRTAIRTNAWRKERHMLQKQEEWLARKKRR